MPEADIEKLRFPIGQFVTPENISESDIASYISDIGNLPAQLRSLVSGLTDKQLDTPYRDNGWTVRQVVHHIADSHVNAYIRFKLAVTEDTPTIKPYFEDKWAELEDGKNSAIEISLSLLESITARLSIFLKSLDKKEFENSYFHPEYGKEFSLGEIAAMYSWHGKHHCSHINELKKKMNW